MADAVVAYVGLGSNRGDRLATLAAAADDLRALPATHEWRFSPVYETTTLDAGARPLPEAPRHLNAVARCLTDTPAPRLLAQLLEIERAHGRQRIVDATADAGADRAPLRTLDLDLLDLGGQTLVRAADPPAGCPALLLPHPRLGERRFVLVPLSDLAPAWRHPDGTPLVELLARLPADPAFTRLAGRLD